MNLARNSIYLLYRDGVSQTEIARTAGVSRQRINQIIGTLRQDQIRRLHLESLLRFADNRETYVESLRRFSANRETYVESLRAFDAARETYVESPRSFDAVREAYLQSLQSFDTTHESYLRSLQVFDGLVRGVREARRRAREIRVAYLEAHPRARLKAVRKVEVPADQVARSADEAPASRGGAILRVVA